MSLPIFNRISNPPVEILLLNKLGFGPNAASLQRIKELGIKGYIEEQLQPDDSQDDLLIKKLKEASYPIGYEKFSADGSKKSIKENRYYELLDAPLSRLWSLHDPAVNYEEKIYPAKQVFGASILRGVYSKWQLKELLVDFWHNHFNVSVKIDDRVAITFPIYDREVIRKNVLGNFRQLLEGVAKSVAMQCFLDNASSKASPANENFARELFELHTLGAEHYLNHLYNRWREVPGAVDGKPEGYIDEDVYEAARAFTGWTIADGADDWKGGKFANTGEFHYQEQWHDNYQKRVLGFEFNPNQPPMNDGKKVLDLLANHPGTAKYICRKLCTRIISDKPSEAIIALAAREWMMNIDSTDQIAKVVKVIAMSEECRLTWGEKIKRPLELVISTLRAVDADVTPNDNLMWQLLQMGQQPYAWPTPTGYPDQADYWINAEMLLRRWNFPINVLNYYWHNYAKAEVADQIPEQYKTCKEVTIFFLKRILGYIPEGDILQNLSVYFADGGRPEREMYGKGNLRSEKVNWLVSAILLLPDFQVR